MLLRRCAKNLRRTRPATFVSHHFDHIVRPKHRVSRTRFNCNYRRAGPSESSLKYRVARPVPGIAGKGTPLRKVAAVILRIVASFCREFSCVVCRELSCIIMVQTVDSVVRVLFRLSSCIIWLQTSSRRMAVYCDALRCILFDISFANI